MIFLRRLHDPPSIFRLSLIIAFIVLLLSAWNAPMSGDEYVHVEQARKNIRYFQTNGEDTTALYTPISRLKHYGQSFDTITTYVADTLDIDDLYRFRHLSNAVAAWLIILFVSLLTLHMTGSRGAAVLAVLLMLITGRFMGHAMNNLKDIPFALSFVWSIYFIFRMLDELPKISWKNVVGIIVGIALGISIRIGGLLIFAYLLLFLFLWIYYLAISGQLRIRSVWIVKVLTLIITIFFLSFGLGILLWPWALEHPISNSLESLQLMHDYPTTVRQIFEGKLYWSDQFPWYYLPKYMLVTLPIIVLVGFMAFFAFKPRSPEFLVKSIFLLIALGFPIFYAMVTEANVYGGWRQMLFIFPLLAVIASLGLWHIMRQIMPYQGWKYVATGIIALLMIKPAYDNMKHYPYQYIYFNEFQGGISGAYGNFELDYYFTSYKDAYNWIDENKDGATKIVAANFIIPEYYKNKPYASQLIDYYNRSVQDWDYAVICNTFLHPYQLKEGIWPPENSVYEVSVAGKPILAVLERRSKQDLEGIRQLQSGKYREAIRILSRAANHDTQNESILVNLARAYLLDENYDMAKAELKKLLDIYPDNEWGMDLLGEVLMHSGVFEEAIILFQNNINNNYKFFHSYVNLAKAYLLVGSENKAIDTLKECLRINPFYEPAYEVYGHLLIDRGEIELGEKMLNFKVEGSSKYGLPQ